MSADKYGFRNFSFCDSHSEVVDSLCKSGGSLKFFDSMYELFTLAACIGYQCNKRSQSKKTGKTIEFNQFRSFENFDGIFLSICLAEEKNEKILDDEEEQIIKRLNIFSEYANGGMEIVKNKILNRPGDLQESFIHYISENGYDFNIQNKDEVKLSKFKHLLDGLG